MLGDIKEAIVVPRVRQEIGKPPMHLCSFCGKTHAQVKVVLGPMVNICEECVRLCSDIIADNKTTGPCAIDGGRDVIEMIPTTL